MRRSAESVSTYASFSCRPYRSACRYALKALDLGRFPRKNFGLAEVITLRKAQIYLVFPPFFLYLCTRIDPNLKLLSQITNYESDLEKTNYTGYRCLVCCRHNNCRIQTRYNRESRVEYRKETCPQTYLLAWK